MRRALKRIGMALVLSAAVLPVVTQASPHRDATHPPARPATTAKAVPLRLAIPDASPTVDPALVADEDNVELANLLYSGLVRLDSSYHVVPSAATRYVISPDRRHYTFYLRPNLRFSNGHRVLPSDFKFAITRSLNPALKSSSAASYLLDIDGASDVLTGKAKSVRGIKVTANSIEITTRWPVPYFLMELTYPTSYALDEKSIRKLGPPDNSAWYSNPVGSGPYRLKSWSPNNKMILVPNQYFAGPKPAVKMIVISLATLSGTSLEIYNFVRRNLDVVNLGYDSSLVGKPGIRQTKSLIIDGIYMNARAMPFADRRVRRALTLAIDRGSAVKKAMGDSVTPFGGFVPIGQSGYDPSLRILPHDVARARAELKAAGYPEGKGFPSTTLYYPDVAMNPGIAKLAVSMAKTWRSALHINVDTKALQINALLAKGAANALPLYLSGWTADYPDPHDWLSLQWKSDALNNNVHYSNRAFDNTVAAADVTWDPRRRQQLYNNAQEILAQDSAWIPMYIPHRLTYIRSTVDNLLLTGYGVMPRAGSWARVSVRSAPGKRHGAQEI